MIVGVPREIKDNEYRVSITPAGANALVRAGHIVLVESTAGVGSGFGDHEYEAVGARVVSDHADTFRRADMVVKVKEPVVQEFDLLREGIIVLTFLHLAASRELTRALLEKKVTGIAYETVELPDGSLPLLVPMSEIAGRMSIQIAAHYLERNNGGSGKLMGGIPGVEPSHVVILGAGAVGRSAAKVALGMGARVTIINRGVNRLRDLGSILDENITTLSSTNYSISQALVDADVLIGAVLVTGAKAPTLVTREMISRMRAGSIVIDVSIDQRGCIETIRPTTHSDPTYLVDGVVHYGVTNIPGAVPRTSTLALSNATLPYVLRLANVGFVNAVTEDDSLAKGVNTFAGNVTHRAVAQEFGLPYRSLKSLLTPPD
jgi:alanine dehydrogenase